MSTDYKDGRPARLYDKEARTMALSKKVVAAYVGVFVLFLSAYLIFKTSPSQLELVSSKNTAVGSESGMSRISPSFQHNHITDELKSSPSKDQPNGVSY